MVKNPKWTRDEIILALDLYFKIGPSPAGETRDEINALSVLLQTLPIHSLSERTETFRNSNSVYMKLRHFHRFDKKKTTRGLEAGSKLDEEIWRAFSGDKKRLGKIARLIAECAGQFAPPVSEAESQSKTAEFTEGRILTRAHELKETNADLVRRKKKSTLQLTGKLACEVCGFDFADAYGKIGDGFAECHHTKPLSELSMQIKTRLADMAVVCSNCHSMLHRCKPRRTIEDLKRMVQGQTTIFAGLALKIDE